MADDMLGKVIKIAMSLGLLFLIYLVIVGIITLVLWGRVGQGDPKGFWYTDRDKLKKYIFKSWIDWAGSPSTFSYFPQLASLASSSVYKTYSNASVNNCMFQCEAANGRSTTKCVGFDFQVATSNICTLYSSMDGIVPIADGNTLYFIDGKDTSRQYVEYANKDMPPLATSNIIESSENFDCFSNCISNVSCTGLLYSNTNTCVLFNSPFDATKLVDKSNTSTYTITTHSAFTSYPNLYY